jgi:hypothetical protein
MKNFLTISTIALATIASLGITPFVSHSLLIDTHPLMAAFQLVIILMLMTLLVTHPPRPKIFRIVTAIGGLALFLIAQVAVLHYQINVLEWLVYTETACILWIEALEVKSTYVAAQLRSSRHLAPNLQS